MLPRLVKERTSSASVRADQKLRAGVQGRFGGGRIEDGAGAEQDAVAQGGVDRTDHVQDARAIAGHLERIDATCEQGFGHANRRPQSSAAEDRHDAARCQASWNLGVCRSRRLV
jgi:hypothetical protein